MTNQEAGIDEQAQLAILELRRQTQSDYIEALIILGAPHDAREGALLEANAIESEILSMRLSWDWPRGASVLPLSFSKLKPFEIVAPHAAKKTLDAVICACKETYSEFGLIALYLIGSRAKGNPRNESDHDFVAVLSDGSSKELLTARSQGLLMLNAITLEASKRGAAKFDLISQHATPHLERRWGENSFSRAVAVSGIRLL